MLLIILSDLEHETQNIDQNTLEIFFLQQEKLFFENQPELIEEKLPDYLADLVNRGINVSILSNTGFIKGELLRALLDSFDISKYFKFQLYSDEMSFSKPSSYVFQEVYKGATGYKKITANNILHIGDNHYADVIGAKNTGMQSALINSNNVSLLNLNIHT
jgi:putative hydrolase of the HAD superfamily